VKATGRA